MSTKQPELQPPFDGPRGWIQWKGTDVCMDVHCACGDQFHIDGDFAYEVQCRACGQVYAVNGNVMLHPIAESTTGGGPLMSDDQDEDPII